MKHIIFVLFLFLSSVLFAQQELPIIKGTVSDSENQALVGALIYWDIGTNSAITDANGKFEIEHIPNAKFLYASYVGYALDSIRVSSNTDVHFTLVAGVLLDNVVVSHKQTSTHTSTLKPVHTLIITESELHKAACCNLSESFETNPSVDVTFTDAITGAKQIQMLGLSGSYVQISRENMPDVRGLATVYGLQFIPGAWIHSIHLNKGTGSVVNGFESITGQIDVQLHDPIRMDSLYVNIFGNESGRMELNISTKERFSHTLESAFLFHAKTLRTKHDVNNDGFIDMPLGDQIIAMNRWEFSGTENMHAQLGIKGTYFTSIGGEMGYNPSQIHSISNPWGMNTSILRADTWFKIGKTYENMPWESIGFQTAASYHNQESQYGVRLYSGKHISGYANLITQGIFGSEIHAYKAGLSMQYDDFAEVFEEIAYNRIEFVPGLFTEYTFTPNSQLTLVGGLRADNHSEFGAFVTPRLHIKYATNTKYVYRLTLGRGQRTANIFSENSNFFASSRKIKILGNGSTYAYGLLPEIAWNFGGSLTRSFTLWYKKGTISFDVYRTVFENQVVVDIIQDPHATVFYNLAGKSFSNSFQTQLDYELINRLDMRLAYRWFDVQTTYNGVLQKKPFVSEHRAFINLSYKTPKQWVFDYTLQWHGAKYITSSAGYNANNHKENMSPSFFTMNAQISKSIHEKLDVYFGGENLLGFVQENIIVNPQNPFSDTFDASLVWGPVYGRELYAGLRYRF